MRKLSFRQKIASGLTGILLTTQAMLPSFAQSPKPLTKEDFPMFNTGEQKKSEELKIDETQNKKTNYFEIIRGEANSEGIDTIIGVGNLSLKDKEKTRKETEVSFELSGNEKGLFLQIYTPDWHRDAQTEEGRIPPERQRYTRINHEHSRFFVLHPLEVKVLESSQYASISSLWSPPITPSVKNIPVTKEQFEKYLGDSPEKEVYKKVLKEMKGRMEITRIPSFLAKAGIETHRAIEIPFSVPPSERPIPMYFFMRLGFGDKESSNTDSTPTGYGELEKGVYFGVHKPINEFLNISKVTLTEDYNVQGYKAVQGESIGILEVHEKRSEEKLRQMFAAADVVRSRLEKKSPKSQEKNTILYIDGKYEFVYPKNIQGQSKEVIIRERRNRLEPPEEEKFEKQYDEILKEIYEEYIRNRPNHLESSKEEKFCKQYEEALKNIKK